MLMDGQVELTVISLMFVPWRRMREVVNVVELVAPLVSVYGPLKAIFGRPQRPVMFGQFIFALSATLLVIGVALLTRVLLLVFVGAAPALDLLEVELNSKALHIERTLAQSFLGSIFCEKGSVTEALGNLRVLWLSDDVGAFQSPETLLKDPPELFTRQSLGNPSYENPLLVQLLFVLLQTIFLEIRLCFEVPPFEVKELFLEDLGHLLLASKDQEPKTRNFLCLLPSFLAMKLVVDG